MASNGFTAKASYDVFLSYNSTDHGVVEDIARKLRDEGLKPFLDRWYLAPGARWRSKLEDTLSSCKAVAIFVGPGEMGSWQQREVDVALDLQSRSPILPVIPVLLPGCEPPLGFLRQLTWVDLRTQTRDLGIVILAKAARGEAPGPDLQKHLDAVRVSICPYRGLLHFREEDAPFFFGREAAIDKLMDAVERRPLVTVVGASGSGKSSVVRAGLVPRLRSDRRTAWETVILVPTDQPLKALARAFVTLLEPTMGEVDRLAEGTKLAEHFRSGTISLYDIVERIVEKQSGTNRVLIVVDQFEELYTLTSDEEARRRFLDELLAASSRAGCKANIALTLRGDFVGKALAYRPLSDRLQDAQINLGPMTREELECAIRKPGERIQLEFEPGLVRRILYDVGDEPGNLPLLEFVLKELWDKRRGSVLLNETYDAIGGLQGAVATKADKLLKGLSSAEQKILQRIFLRIVRPSTESSLDTRRRAAFTELPPEGKELVGKLTDERLLVTNQSASGLEQTVEIAHEALISNWATLRAWVNEDREFLLWRDRLGPLVAEWERAQESDEAVLRGPLLIEAQKWFDQRSQDLSDQEREFISASREQRERLAREEKERQQRKLAEAEERRQEQAAAAKSLRRLAWVLAAVALAAVGGAIFGFWQKNEAEHRKQDAEVAKAEAKRQEAIAKDNANKEKVSRNAAEKQAKIAETERLAAQSSEKKANDARDQAEKLLEEAARSDRLVAEEKLAKGEDGEALAYLARASRYTPKSSLSAEAAIPAVLSPLIAHSQITLQGHSDWVSSAVFSPDGQRVLTAAWDNTARLWEADSGKLLAIFQGHSGPVTSAVFSPDGRRVLTASGDKTARLWEADSGKLLAIFQGHSGPVTSAVFSPDGRRVLTASGDLFHPSVDNTARLWEADSGKLLATFQGHSDSVWKAVFSPDGQRVLTTSGDKTARLWEADSGKLLATFQGHSDSVWNAVFSPDGRRVLTASGKLFPPSGDARLWEADSGKLLATFQGHRGQVNSAVFSPDGRRVLTAAWDNTARLWEADSGKLLATFHSGPVWTAVFSSDGRRVLTASGNVFTDSGDARLWEADSGKLLATFQGQNRPVTSAVFSPDGRRVLTASGSLITGSGDARLWEVDGGGLLATFQGHTDPVLSAAFSPDGRRVLTASGDKTARLWEADSGKLLATFQGHSGQVNSAVFSPDGRRVLTASGDKTARLWEADSGKLLATFQGHSNSVWKAVFSPDGRRVLTASGNLFPPSGDARLWEADSGKLLATFQGHSGQVNSAVFSPDGRRVLTASWDQTARLWEADSGKLLATFQGHTLVVDSAVFSPDGRRVLTASGDKTARLWEADSRKLLATFQGHTDSVTSAVFSPDGRRVLTASVDKTARLWEADNGKLLATFQGHSGPVTSAVFSPDGRRMLTASVDNTARLWVLLPANLPPPDWCATFLVWLGGKRIAPDGEIETLSGEELGKLEDRLRSHLNENSDYARLLRWRLLSPKERPVDPYGTITQEQEADLIIRPGMNRDEAERAYDLDPWHPLVNLALAGFEKDPLRADFLRQYSLDRLPNDPKLRQRAAEFLRKQGKEDLARRIEARGE